VRVLYEFLDDWRAAIGYGHVTAEYKPRTDPLVDEGDQRFTPVVLSLERSGKTTTLTAEISTRRIEFRNFAFPLNGTMTGLSYYLQGEYRFGDGWTGLLRYDAHYADLSDKSGKEYAATTGRPAHLRYARDATLGIRKDVSPSFMVAAEWHHVTGGPGCRWRTIRIPLRSRRTGTWCSWKSPTSSSWAGVLEGLWKGLHPQQHPPQAADDDQRGKQTEKPHAWPAAIRKQRQPPVRRRPDGESRGVVARPGTMYRMPDESLECMP
jgi:hypothetical protein